ncbi:MAG: hypothetical protein M3373_11485 [Gemmatimonadota bacterium]|nr:hypothetical protein [Gemmatimonadota bacterium]
MAGNDWFCLTALPPTFAPSRGRTRSWSTQRCSATPLPRSSAQPGSPAVGRHAQRQLSTEQALTEIEALIAEKAEAERARRESGLDAGAFAAYWVLHREFPEQAIALAREIGAYARDSRTPPATRMNTGR